VLFRVSDIAKSYGGHEVLRGVSFQVNAGDKVGLVGRNGAGKTTLIRILTGEESADTGDVITAGGIKFGLLEQQVGFAPDETVHTAALSAFSRIHDIEAEMRALEKRMETDHSPAVLERYAELQTAFEQADGFSYAARAEAVLLGVGFTTAQWSMETSTLSGGQRNRLGMARLLLSDADVMLLDEPTNHLDVGAVEWLEQYLQASDRAYVVISHDRYFLDRTANRIIELDNGRAVGYRGNYSKYLEEREIRREHQQREYENQQSLISKTEEFIRRNLEGQKTKQAKSRRNMLERLERLDPVKSEKHGGNFKLRNVERTGNDVLRVEELAIGYGSRVLASSIDVVLHRGEVLGVIGGNGTGKTTFLRTIIGELPLLGGRINWGTRTDIGYYSQTLTDLHDGNDVINELRRVAPMVESGELRSFLARFLFFGDDVEKKVRDLSGGEKGRLALAKLIYSKKNVLVLDEPTNHLDIPAREALESALEEYPGTIVTVSHDRFFLDRLATQILSFEPDGTVLGRRGNYTEFQEARTPPSAPAVQPSTHADEDVRAPGADESVRVPLSKNERQRLEARLAEIEKTIPQLEASVAELSLSLSTPEVAADPARFGSVTKEMAEAEARIRALYDEWAEASATLS
jgi:ATP-binding cassette, subfamily F, member 3